MPCAPRPALAVFIVVLAQATGHPLSAQTTPTPATEVDLELVLLADASGSIDQAEIAFQRDGYASAITDPAVIAAIDSTLTGSIAVTYVEWGKTQGVVVGWSIIDGRDSAEAFASALRAQPRAAGGRNAIGMALLTGQRLIDTNDIAGIRRVIDFSSDSTGNFSGPSIRDARDVVLASGITINGLPILRPGSVRVGNLVAEYEAQIIGGPGAFVVAADGLDKFAEAVRRKLILEIAGADAGPAGTHAALSAEPLAEPLAGPVPRWVALRVCAQAGDPVRRELHPGPGDAVVVAGAAPHAPGVPRSRNMAVRHQIPDLC